MRQVAITGGAGFIGSHAAVALSGLGASVRILAWNEVEARRVSRLCSSVVQISDITDVQALQGAFRDAETIVHAAGPPSVAASLRDPVEFVRVHTLGTAVALQAAVGVGVRRFIYISSAEVYDRACSPKVPETHPVAASSPYAAAKIGAEQLARSFAVTGSIEVIVLRPFSVYGVGMSPLGVVAEILSKAQQGEKIQIRSATPVRDFCFAPDIGAAVAAACFAEVRGFTVANLGTGIGTSIGELSQLVLELTDAPGIEVTHRERPGEGSASCLVADPTSAIELLGWAASTSLRSGLEKTLEGMKRS